MRPFRGVLGVGGKRPGGACMSLFAVSGTYVTGLLVGGELGLNVLIEAPVISAGAVRARRRRPTMRTLVDLLPGRYAQFALRLRELLAPQPDPHEAAVELFKAERRARGILPYPQYLYGLLTAARTALAVGSTSFTAIEFGVAGGNGLRALERHAEYIERRFPLAVTVLGFDSGRGLLTARDRRDCGFALPPGAFAMEEAELRASLKRAELVLGPVEETVAPFMANAEARRLPPIGFASIDLDVFTGTLAVLRGIAADVERLLPRVALYIDDLYGYPYSSEDGEWAAIKAFNESSDSKIGKVVLKHQVGGTARFMAWPEQFFRLDVFDHPAYDAVETTEMPDTALRTN